MDITCIRILSRLKGSVGLEVGHINLIDRIQDRFRFERGTLKALGDFVHKFLVFLLLSQAIPFP